MSQAEKDLIGRIQVFQSFLIEPDGPYGIVADLLEGAVRPGLYAHIPLNSAMAIAARIDEVKKIQLSGEDEWHQLLLFNELEPEAGVEGWPILLQAMNVGNEIIEIRVSGSD